MYHAWVISQNPIFERWKIVQTIYLLREYKTEFDLHVRARFEPYFNTLPLCCLVYLSIVRKMHQFNMEIKFIIIKCSRFQMYYFNKFEVLSNDKLIVFLMNQGAWPSSPNLLQDGILRPLQGRVPMGSAQETCLVNNQLLWRNWTLLVSQRLDMTWRVFLLSPNLRNKTKYISYSQLFRLSVEICDGHKSGTIQAASSHVICCIRI